MSPRRRRHEALTAHLEGMSDGELQSLMSAAGSWRANVHGNQAAAIELDGTRIFVKAIALTDLERRPAHEGSTANLFGLPLFYQYGVGSAGFGAWRELRAALAAGAWSLSGACPHFPLVHHWRVLPRRPLALSPDQIAWLERAPAYWDGSPAVRARLAAIGEASASVVLFMEHLPDTLDTWLARALAAGPRDAALEAKIAALDDQWRAAAAFLNARGVLHFDLHAFNMLTDGERLYVADFGLALGEDYDLSADERAFFEAHRQYDRAYLAWAFREWLKPRLDPSALGPALQARLRRDAPAGRMLRRFFTALADGPKTTPYPQHELRAALAAA